MPNIEFLALFSWCIYTIYTDINTEFTLTLRRVIAFESLSSRKIYLHVLVDILLTSIWVIQKKTHNLDKDREKIINELNCSDFLLKKYYCTICLIINIKIWINVEKESYFWLRYCSSIRQTPLMNKGCQDLYVKIYPLVWYTL